MTAIGRKTMSEYPWESVSPNSKPGQYAVRSIDTDGEYPWLDVSWGISPKGCAALIICYNAKEPSFDPLPQFASIKVQESKADGILAIELIASDSMDMFYRICLDLIEAVKEANPEQIRSTCLFRLEKWSSLLKRQSQLLSKEEQKGLIAELLTLKDCILPVMDEESALCGWSGPDGGTQDFNYGQTAIEVKSKRKSSQSHVLISSETQLSASSNERLFLRVVELNFEQSRKGFTLNDVVAETRGSLSSPLHRAHMDSKLASAGYFEEDSYEAFAWSLGSIYTYEVVLGFPRIAKDSVDCGIDRVSYRLDLDYCAEFLSSDQEIAASLRS